MPDGLVSWPMYAVDREIVEGFWIELRQALRAVGLGSVPEHLSWPDDLYAHWLSPELLLSQTCGYPYVTRLAGHVRYVATPRFRAAGCDGPFYSSAVIVRRTPDDKGLAAYRGARVAFNGRDSQSGYNALRALVAPYATAGRFFGDAIETGSHRASIEAVRTGGADLAAIDAVTLAQVTAAYPREIEGLRVLTYTRQVPGLPFVTSLSTSAHDVDLLRRALTIACTTACCREGLLLDEIEVLPATAYRCITAMEAEALELGYTQLS